MIQLGDCILAAALALVIGLATGYKLGMVQATRLHWKRLAFAMKLSTMTMSQKIAFATNYGLPGTQSLTGKEEPSVAK